MIGFKTTLLKFDQQGEKTGWTYILIPKKIVEKLNPGSRKSFRVKGNIDDYQISSVALLPMGGGDFIMPVNSIIRRAIKKTKGAPVVLEMEPDNNPIKISPELLACLQDEPSAKDFFKNLPPSHRHYYSNWIQSARTDETKTKRIAVVLNAFTNKWTFSQMMQAYRKDI